MKKTTLSFTFKSAIFSIVFLCSSFTVNTNNWKGFKQWNWTLVNENASWDARAGLQALYHNDKFYIIGGRTPLNPFIYNPPIPGASTIWGDVWTSKNFGRSWKQILSTSQNDMWPARAYFQAVSMGKYMYILGGQNFNIIDNPECAFLPPGVPCDTPKVPKSDFFNDVWRSMDGINWQKRTMDLPEDSDERWSQRAGLSAVAFKNELYVMGGSYLDDASVVGGPPLRKYYNDVWKSSDKGKTWVKVSRDNAPNRWSPRAGGIAVTKGGYIYMIGGEAGFTCPPPDIICPNPPYYNDVWRTKNGVDWELVTDNAEWSPRPGHQVVVSQGKMVLFGGFGLIGNPSDVWVSSNGKNWKQVNDAPWNAQSSDDIKYDFDAVAVPAKKWRPAAIYSFGGDRESFDFNDPTNYLNVDNDVWKYSFTFERKTHQLALHQNYPNGFRTYTTIPFVLPNEGNVKLEILNSRFKVVKTLLNEVRSDGEHEVKWNGTNNNNIEVRKGIYFIRLTFNEKRLHKIALKR